MELLTMQTALDDWRIIGRTWADGSFNCPFCFAAVRPTDRGCPNPACDTNATADGLRSSGDVLYRGEVIGGRRRRSIEGLMTRRVTERQVPRTAFPWIAQRVTDALASARGADPVHRVQPVTLVHVAAFGSAWLRAPMERLLAKLR